MINTRNIPPYELELILAHILQKSREYVLAHPEIKLNKIQNIKYKKLVSRRKKHEPMAYILGKKEFYGLNFKVTKDTLIPRPETEMLVELTAHNIKHETPNKNAKTIIIDVGTGSGNIIISLAKELEKNKGLQATGYMLYGLDSSLQAIRIARQNAKRHKMDKTIKFIKSDLLKYFLDNNETMKQCGNAIIVANLPYVSQKIYSSVSPDIKNYEPKSALLSGKDGLDHYRKLLDQIKKLKESYSMLPACRQARYVTCYMEFSPEQRTKLQKIIKENLPSSKVEFQKDLARKWRVAIIKV